MSTPGRRAAAMARRFIGETVRVLSLLPESSASACVYGWPDYEENSLFAAIALAEETPLRVTLLAENVGAAERYLAVASRNGAAIDVIAKHSLRGLLRASTAGVLLFTHGLYGSPDLAGRKLVVNLWHGFGPKANDNVAFSARIPFDMMTCNTPVWARAAARWLGVPDARLVQTGNPRQAAMHLPVDLAALARLGLAESRYVLWMPTYRSSNGSSGPVWRDAPALSGGTAARHDTVTTIAQLAAASGVEVIVKPHPLDGDRYEAGGLRVLTTEEVFDAGMTLYQLIGASAGMISDYSSVWGEYLELDRPLLLFCPDIADYVEGRGLSEPYMTDVAGALIVQEAEEVGAFLRAVQAGQDWRPADRERVRTALQLDAAADRPSFGAVVMRELAGRRNSVGRHSRLTRPSEATRRRGP